MIDHIKVALAGALQQSHITGRVKFRMLEDYNVGRLKAVLEL